ncbi:MAG TPA: ABC transporter ATP-binding protein [Alphaproteobacteria bacterium]|nr:ABC transporter ATP-binding protein [Alphaproteobacteria bacterium]
MPATSQPLVAAHEIVKSFSGFRALDGLNFSVREGSIHAVIGPNGAGKSTLLGVLSGFVRATSGRVTIGSADTTKLDPASIARMGVVRSFQISSIFPHSSALDNVKIALQARSNLSWRLLEPARAAAVLDEPARRALAAVGIDGERDTAAANLAYGKKRALELAIAVSQEPSVLLLDEPTAGMGTEDVERTIALIREIARARTVVLVEHNLRVVEHLCDRVTVLARGKVLAEGSYEEVRADERVVEAYLGGARH